VLVAAIGVGGALCWILAEMRPVFVNAASLRMAMGLPVIGSVSRALDARARLKRHFSWMALMGAVAGLALVFAAAVLIEVAGPGLHQLAGLS
jgi:hypothetical protein